MIRYKILRLGAEEGSNHGSGKDDLGQAGVLTRLERIKEKIEQFDGEENLLLYGKNILLRDDLAEIAKFAKKTGFERIKVKTSCLGLESEERVRKLVNAGLYLYEIVTPVVGGIGQAPGTDRMAAFKSSLETIKSLMYTRIVPWKPFRVFIAINIPVAGNDQRLISKAFDDAAAIQPYRLIMSAGGEIDINDFTTVFKQAADKLLKLRVWLEARGVPPCILTGSLAYHWGEMYFGPDPEIIYERLAVCAGCALDGFCPGAASGLVSGNLSGFEEPVDEKMGRKIVENVVELSEAFDYIDG